MNASEPGLSIIMFVVTFMLTGLMVAMMISGIWRWTPLNACYAGVVAINAVFVIAFTVSSSAWMARRRLR